MRSSRPINKVFEDASDELANLITRTRQLNRLTHILRRYLDEQLARHCYVGNIKKPTLTILVDSANWATRLRFVAPDLLGKISQDNQLFSGVERINIRILTPSREKEDPLHRPGPQMSNDNARGIRSLAESIEDPDLQRALNKLARHVSED
jgi:hypothetical protein